MFDNYNFIGTRSAPREIILDNTILPSDVGHVRVSTPPRVITLSEHHFPSASEEPQYQNDEGQDEYESNSVNSSDDRRLVPSKPTRRLFNQDLMNQR